MEFHQLPCAVNVLGKLIMNCSALDHLGGAGMGHWSTGDPVSLHG